MATNSQEARYDGSSNNFLNIKNVLLRHHHQQQHQLPVVGAIPISNAPGLLHLTHCHLQLQVNNYGNNHHHIPTIPALPVILTEQEQQQFHELLIHHQFNQHQQLQQQFQQQNLQQQHLQHQHQLLQQQPHGHLHLLNYQPQHHHIQHQQLQHQSYQQQQPQQLHIPLTAAEQAQTEEDALLVQHCQHLLADAKDELQQLALMNLDVNGFDLHTSNNISGHHNNCIEKAKRPCRRTPEEKARHAERERIRRGKLSDQRSAEQRARHAERERLRRSRLPPDRAALERAKHAERERLRRRRISEGEMRELQVKRAERQRYHRSLMKQTSIENQQIILVPPDTFAQHMPINPSELMGDNADASPLRLLG